MSSATTKEYWVGTLPERGIVVYDPSIQDDDSEYVYLFELKTNTLKKHHRETTRGKIDKVSNTVVQENAIEAYEKLKVKTANPAQQARLGAQSALAKAASSGDNDDNSGVLHHAIDSMQTVLESRERELVQLHAELEGLKQELARKDKALSETRATVHKLENLTEQIDSVETLEKLTRKAALYASGDDSAFKAALLSLKLDGTLPIHLAAKLEFKLRRLLDLADPSVNLSELIRQAQQDKAIDRDAIDMAYIIRNQRNKLAHSTDHSSAFTARILISLFAASLLWPKLPK